MFEVNIVNFTTILGRRPHMRSLSLWIDYTLTLFLSDAELKKKICSTNHDVFNNPIYNRLKVKLQRKHTLSYYVRISELIDYLDSEAFSDYKGEARNSLRELKSCYNPYLELFQYIEGSNLSETHLKYLEDYFQRSQVHYIYKENLLLLSAKDLRKLFNIKSEFSIFLCVMSVLKRLMVLGI